MICCSTIDLPLQRCAFRSDKAAIMMRQRKWRLQRYSNGKRLLANAVYWRATSGYVTLRYNNSIILNAGDCGKSLVRTSAEGTSSNVRIFRTLGVQYLH
jgi:hypothetical protein